MIGLTFSREMHVIINCLIFETTLIITRTGSSEMFGFGPDDYSCTESEGKFLCANGKCIESARRFDFVRDCEDNSDEAKDPCRSPAFTCSGFGPEVSGRCLPAEWVNNGKPDCPAGDMSDEAKWIGTNCTMAVSCCFCEDYIENSACIDGTCQCLNGYYPNDRKTTCIRRYVGDSCAADTDCTAVITHSSCAQLSVHTLGSCQCLTGYRPTAGLDHCEPEPRKVLPQYKPVSLPVWSECEEPLMLDNDAGNMTDITSASCNISSEMYCISEGHIGSSCRCVGGFTRWRQSTICIRAKSYTIRVNCTSKTGIHELVPLIYDEEIMTNDSTAYWQTIYRIKYDGVQQMITEAGGTLFNDLVSVGELLIDDSEPGLSINVQIQLLYNTTLNITDIQYILADVVIRNRGEIGRSKYFVNNASLESIVIDDYNECSGEGAWWRRVDCDPVGASCANIMGHFECICTMNYIDESTDPQFTGRICSGAAKEEKAQALEEAIKNAGCTDGVCETSWSSVLLVTSLVFTVLVALFTAEVVARTRQMRRHVGEKRSQKPGVIQRHIIATVYDVNNTLKFNNNNKEGEEERNVNKRFERTSSCDQLMLN